VSAAVAGVPVGVLIANRKAQLGRGQVTSPLGLPPAAPRLNAGGRPEIMFVCAEYWFKCAAERWAFVMALAKFGKFTTLMGTTSSAARASQRMPTFSFYGAATLPRLTKAAPGIQGRQIWLIGASEWLPAWCVSGRVIGSIFLSV
jgi:Domain of unknown function (DUF929)